MISSYTILIVITVLVGLATIVLAQFMPDVTGHVGPRHPSSPISGLDGTRSWLFLSSGRGCLGIVE